MSKLRQIYCWYYCMISNQQFARADPKEQNDMHFAQVHQHATIMPVATIDCTSFHGDASVSMSAKCQVALSLIVWRRTNVHSRAAAMLIPIPLF